MRFNCNIGANSPRVATSIGGSFRESTAGSDYPSPGVASMKKNVEDFLSLPLSEAAREKILWSNAAALIT